MDYLGADPVDVAFSVTGSPSISEPVMVAKKVSEALVDERAR